MTATLLPEPLEPGSPEWLQTISASKVAAILGLSPWATAYSLWHLMRGTCPPEPENQAMSNGTFWEPAIREWFADAHPEWFVDETTTWRNDARPWQTADPDGLIYTGHADRTPPWGGLEVKFVHDYLGSAGWGKSGTDEVPDYYRVQGMWQCDTLGLDRVIFAVCGFRELADRKPAEYVVEYDAAEAARLRSKANAFRMSVAMGVEPRDPDFYRDEDYRALKFKNREVSAAGVDIPDELAIPWLEALAAADEAAKAEARTRGALVEFLGTGKTAEWHGAKLGSRRRTTPPSFSKATGLDPVALLNPTPLKEAS